MRKRPLGLAFNSLRLLVIAFILFIAIMGFVIMVVPSGKPEHKGPPFPPGYFNSQLAQVSFATMSSTANDVYIVHGATGNFQKFNLATHRVYNFGVPVVSGKFVISPDGSLICSFENGRIMFYTFSAAQIGNSDGSVELTNPGANSNPLMQFSNDGSTLYVLVNKTIYVVSINKRMILKTILLKKAAVSFAVSADNSKLYFIGGSGASGYFFIMSLLNNEVILESETNEYSEISIAGTAGTVALLSSDRRTITIMNGTSIMREINVQSGLTPSKIVYNSNSNNLIVVSESSNGTIFVTSISLASYASTLLSSFPGYN